MSLVPNALMPMPFVPFKKKGQQNASPIFEIPITFNPLLLCLSA